MIRRPPRSPLFPYTPLSRSARFEQLDDARQTAGDVLRLRRSTRNLGENVAGVNVLAVVHHEVCAGREEVLLLLAALATRLDDRSEEHTSELQSQSNLVCRLL